MRMPGATGYTTASRTAPSQIDLAVIQELLHPAPRAGTGASVDSGASALATGAIDGHFVGGTTGVYYDIAAHNAKTPTLVVDSPSSVHFLVPYDPDNSQLHNEIGRNSFENPGRILTDVALEKGFQIPKFERARLLLRVEAQDIANHNNLNIENTTVNNIGNGQFLNRHNSELDAGRQLVLWAKFTF